MAEAVGFFELNTGAKIPSVGLGTWAADTGVIVDAITTAVKVQIHLVFVVLVLDLFKFYCY